MTSPAVASKSPKEVVEAWFERVWNQGDESAIDELADPNASVKGLPGGTIYGAENFKPFVRAFRSAFPDIKIAVTHCITEGEFCATHCVVTGTHTGGGIGVAATQKSVTFTGMALVRVANGRLQEGLNSFDFLSLYQQLGLVKQDPTAI